MDCSRKWNMDRPLTWLQGMIFLYITFNYKFSDLNKTTPQINFVFGTQLTSDKYFLKLVITFQMRVWEVPDAPLTKAKEYTLSEGKYTAQVEQQGAEEADVITLIL